jgi:DNA-binding LytR/AlgR family response regulator
VESTIRILIIEDEMIFAAKISLQLSSIGYEVTGILPHGEDALQHVVDNKVDILLLDIHLKGKLDGIATALQIRRLSKIPIIYLTANGDEATFNRAKMTKPAGFISKPYRQIDLHRAIELAYARASDIEDDCNEDMSHHEHPPVILSDRIFVRCREKMLRIMMADILYIEADRNYSRIFTGQKEFLLSTTLKTIDERLTNHFFVRIHRSYIVNLAHIDEVGEGHVVIAQKSIPLSAGLRDHLLERIQTL